MDYGDFTIVLPTLNEGRTIGKLITYIRSHYKGAKIIVADDGSVDGTAGIVNGFERKGGVRFIDRRRMGLQKGLTASVIDGIERSRSRYVVVMDADMQHPPAEISRIAAKLASGYDLAVASRASVVGWELGRKVISRLLIHLGYLSLSVQGSESNGDIFSGYFGVRRSLFVSVYARNRRRFIGGGYKVLFDFLKCVKKGEMKVCDVPFAFQVRKFGRSKAGAAQGLALLHSFLS